MILYYSIAIYLLCINLWTFLLYARDKSKARKAQFRIPESRLILLAFLGGGLGAWLAMRIYHHKTLHWKFRICVPLFTIVWVLFFSSVSAVWMLRKGEIRVSPLMVRRYCENLANNHSISKQYQWVDYHQISPYLVRAVMASEDDRFLQHHGIEYKSFRKAVTLWYNDEYVKFGGSTISQQTAKNLFTLGYRNAFRKGVELWYTFWIEQLWGKQRIMEVYLNIIEMGDGIYGAEAASQAYFHHPANTLSAQESALIAVCLPNPRRLNVAHPSAYVQKRQQQILRLMPNLGPIKMPNER